MRRFCRCSHEDVDHHYIERTCLAAGYGCAQYTYAACPPPDAFTRAGLQPIRIPRAIRERFQNLPLTPTAKHGSSDPT